MNTAKLFPTIAAALALHTTFPTSVLAQDTRGSVAKIIEIPETNIPSETIVTANLPSILELRLDSIGTPHGESLEEDSSRIPEFRDMPSTVRIIDSGITYVPAKNSPGNM